MDEDTKQAIFEIRDSLKEMLVIMREQKAMAEKLGRRAINANMNLAKFAELLPPQAKAMFGNLTNMAKRKAKMTTNFHTPWVDKTTNPAGNEFSAASMNVLPGELDAAITWMRIPHTLTSGASVAVNWATARIQFLDCAHDAVLTFSGGSGAGGIVLLVLAIKANAQTPTLPATVRYGTDIPSVAFSPGGKWDYLGFIYNDADGKYDLVSVVKGF